MLPRLKALPNPGSFTAWLSSGWFGVGSFTAVILASGCDCLPGVVSGGRRVQGPVIFVGSGVVGAPGVSRGRAAPAGR